jgi:hypothetical protein
VPSVGGSLTSALSAVAEAEAVLERRREDARRAARRAGVSLANLFGDCRFVRRESADRWYQQGKRDGADETVRALCRATGTPADSPEFAQDTAEIRRRHAATKQRWRKFKAGGFADAVADGDYALAAELYQREFGDPARATSDAILAAARKRDAGGSTPLQKPGDLASRVLAAGRKRREPFGGR